MYNPVYTDSTRTTKSWIHTLSLYRFQTSCVTLILCQGENKITHMWHWWSKIHICIQGHLGCVWTLRCQVIGRCTWTMGSIDTNSSKDQEANVWNSRFGDMYACDEEQQRHTFSFRIKLSWLSNVVTCRSCGSMTTALFVSKSGCFRFFCIFGLLANGSAACSACGILRGLNCLGCLSIFCTRYFHKSSYPSKLQNICKKCWVMSKVVHYS